MEKVKLTVAGEVYSLSTDDDADYVMSLGAELDKKINTLMTNVGRISVTQAAVLTALEYIDLSRKTEADCEKLRTQLEVYLEDAAKSRADAELSRREAEKLAKELAALKGEA